MTNKLLLCTDSARAMHTHYNITYFVGFYGSFNIYFFHIFNIIFLLFSFKFNSIRIDQSTPSYQ